MKERLALTGRLHFNLIAFKSYEKLDVGGTFGGSDGTLRMVKWVSKQIKQSFDATASFGVPKRGPMKVVGGYVGFCLHFPNGRYWEYLSYIRAIVVFLN